MTRLRKSLAVIAALGTLLILLLGVMAGSKDSMIEETLGHSRQISTAFDAGFEFVENFRQTQGRLPTETEFREWTSAQPDRPNAARHIHLVTGGYPTELIQRYGKAPPGSYAFEYWRGEWFEYYASWARASTLTFDTSDYYISGSSTGDVVITLVCAFALGVFTWRLWPRPTRHPNS